MEQWSITVRPTIVARLVYLPFYVFPPMIGAALLLLIEFPIVMVARGSFSGPVPDWAVPLLVVGWIALSVPFFIPVYRMIRFFDDRAGFG